MVRSIVLFLGAFAAVTAHGIEVDQSNCAVPSADTEVGPGLYSAQSVAAVCTGLLAGFEVHVLGDPATGPALDGDLWLDIHATPPSSAPTIASNDLLARVRVTAPLLHLMATDATAGAALAPSGRVDLAPAKTYLAAGQRIYLVAWRPGAAGQDVSPEHSLHVNSFIEPLEDESLLDALLAEVTGIGPGTSLADKVRLARTYFAVPDPQAGCAVMDAFQNEVRAQRGKLVPAGLAEAFIFEAQGVKISEGCK
jgi:hypothetical protein